MLKWTRKESIRSNPMSSGARKGAAPPPPQGVLVKASPQDSIPVSKEDAESVPYNNGSGPPSITNSNSTDGDENSHELSEDFPVDLRVILPNGNSSAMEVDANIPMIDLLIHLAGRARLNPAGHKLVVISEETGKTVDYKANQTIGSLGISIIHLVDKKAVNEKNKRNTYIHPVTNKEQPFEMTYRLTVNLPRNQKSVIRINPKVQLQHLFKDVCEDKNLDPQKFTFQHPAKPDHPLDPRMTVGDLNSNEINLVPANSLSDHAISMPDLRRSESSRVTTTPQGTQQQYMPGTTSEKKKSRIFSFFKKEKKYKPSTFSEVPAVATPPRKPTGGSPQLRRSPEKPKQDRPKTMYAGMPPEGNGHLPTQSNSNGQLPQGTGATPKIVQSQTLQRPTHRAAPSPQTQTIASHTLPKPASKSPNKGHGKKRQAPPPPQLSPASQAQQNQPTVSYQQASTPPQSSASIPSSSSPPSASPPQVSRTPPQPLNGSPSAKVTDKLPPKSDSNEKLNKIITSSTKGGISEGADVNISVNQNNSGDNVEEPMAEISESKSGEISVNVETGVHVSKRPHEHSRTSSDSSGYHEATLSGPESPEANRPLSLNYSKDTSMDSASIESSEIVPQEKTVPTSVTNMPTTAALNIPSLRSQMRNRDDDNEVIHTVPGDYVTLPRSRVDKKAKETDQKKDGLTRSHSLEKESKMAPVHRKKKAPAPPPPTEAGNSPKLSNSSDSRSSLSHSPSASLSISVNQSAMETSETRPTINGQQRADSTEELQQKGAEKAISKLQSEDGQRHSRTQPPLFIPPPPPDTPPPPETPPITQNSVKLIDDRQVIDSSTATKEVNVAVSTTTELEVNNSIATDGEELDVSLATEGVGLNTSITSDKSASSKSSPHSPHSRSESRTSKTSISTIEDVNLAFDETIALAEEVWGKNLEDPDVEREINKVISKESPVQSSKTSLVDETVSTTTTANLSQSQFDNNAQLVENTTVESDIKHSSVSVETDDVALRRHIPEDTPSPNDFVQGDKGVSEITYDFKVDAVPPGFTGEPRSRQSMSSEEEEITFIEEEVVFTGPSELIQIYKDDAKVQYKWQKDWDKQIASTFMTSTEGSPVPGASVPDWDTAAKDQPIRVQPPQEETIVRAKMVMVQPEPREPLATSYSQEIVRSSSRNVEKNVSSSEAIGQNSKSHELKSNDSKFEKSDSLLRYIREESKIRHRRDPEESKEKEEFVFAKSDLNKLDFLGGKKPKKPFARVSPPLSSLEVRPKPTPFPEVSRIISKPSKPFMVPQPYRSPSIYSETDSMQSTSASYAKSTETKSSSRTDLNFVPTTESEAENVLEEKSISMINLPATRVSSSQRNTSSLSGDDGVNSSTLTSVSSVKLSEKTDTGPSWSVSRTQNKTNESRQRNDVKNNEQPVVIDQQELVNAQYSQLQDQFAMWQQQLVQNQALLAQHKIMPEDQSQQLQQLQLQLQLQQQMMEQLQQSMQALALQGAVTGMQQPVIQPVATVQVSRAVAPPPTPPVAPAPPAATTISSVVRSEPKTSSKSKNKKRFERQLDPREELMLTIRQAAGRNCLKKVTVKEARWTNKPFSGDQH